MKKKYIWTIIVILLIGFVFMSWIIRDILILAKDISNNISEFIKDFIEIIRGLLCLNVKH